MQTAGWVTYLDDMVKTIRGCVTAGSPVSGELLCGKRFPLTPKRTVYQSYVRPLILFMCEV